MKKNIIALATALVCLVTFSQTEGKAMTQNEKLSEAKAAVVQKALSGETASRAIQFASAEEAAKAYDEMIILFQNDENFFDEGKLGETSAVFYPFPEGMDAETFYMAIMMQGLPDEQAIPIVVGTLLEKVSGAVTISVEKDSLSLDFKKIER